MDLSLYEFSCVPSGNFKSPEVIAKPDDEKRAISTPFTTKAKTPVETRYKPVPVSLAKANDGVANAPFTSLNGPVIPPSPFLERELVKASAISAKVAFAHVDSIVVPETTGLPVVSVKFPAPLRGI